MVLVHAKAGDFHAARRMPILVSLRLHLRRASTSGKRQGLSS